MSLSFFTTSDEDTSLNQNLLTFTLMLLLVLIIQHYIGLYSKNNPTAIFISESGATILIGIIFSIIHRYIYRNYNHKNIILEFDSSFFFFVLLPPIIFNSGYHLKRKLFFANIAGIIGLAVFGAIISAVLISFGTYYLSIKGYIIPLKYSESLAFGALISSTDPVSVLSVFSSLRVDPTLFYLVFGESVILYLK